jgi:hypothetical protein
MEHEPWPARHPFLAVGVIVCLATVGAVAAQRLDRDSPEDKRGAWVAYRKLIEEGGCLDGSVFDMENGAAVATTVGKEEPFRLTAISATPGKLGELVFAYEGDRLTLLAGQSTQLQEFRRCEGSVPVQKDAGP